MNFKEKLARYAPPGINLGQELGWFVGGISTSVLYSLGFLFRYSREYQSLFLRDGVTKVLDTDAVMPDFIKMLGGSLNIFLVLALSMAFVTIYHYSYHYQDSKSIYLMWRLPDRWELPKRCLALPLMGILACLCVALMLLIIYYAIYMLFTPQACLAPDQWHKIWSVILGVGI